MCLDENEWFPDCVSEWTLYSFKLFEKSWFTGIGYHWNWLSLELVIIWIGYHRNWLSLQLVIENVIVDSGNFHKLWHQGQLFVVYLWSKCLKALYPKVFQATISSYHGFLVLILFEILWPHGDNCLRYWELLDAIQNLELFHG